MDILDIFRLWNEKFDDIDGNELLLIALVCLKYKKAYSILKKKGRITDNIINNLKQKGYIIGFNKTSNLPIIKPFVNRLFIKDNSIDKSILTLKPPVVKQKVLKVVNREEVIAGIIWDNYPAARLNPQNKSGKTTIRIERKSMIRRLELFFKKYPEYKDLDIKVFENAVKMYVGPKTLITAKLLRTSTNFIYDKQKDESVLATEIENLASNPHVDIDNNKRRYGESMS